MPRCRMHDHSGRLVDDEQPGVLVKDLHPRGLHHDPRQPVRAPRAWIETKFNVQHWTDMPRGGHFAAMEQPESFYQDVRKFFGTLR